MRSETRLKQVLARIFTKETPQVFMNGNFALDYASLVKLAINTSKQCQRSAMDCVVMHSSQHEMLA